VRIEDEKPMGKLLDLPIRDRRPGTQYLLTLCANDGVDGAPNGISVTRWSLSKPHLKGSRPWASLSGITSCVDRLLSQPKIPSKLIGVACLGVYVKVMCVESGLDAPPSVCSPPFAQESK
jgi:hypothetical protein